MLKRELKFRTFLLPLMMVSFMPTLGHGDDQTLEIQSVEPYQTPSRTFNTPAPASVTPPASQASASAAAPPSSFQPMTLTFSKDASGELVIKNPNGQVIKVPADVLNSVANQPAASPQAPVAQVAPIAPQELAGPLDYSQLNAAVKGLEIKVNNNEARLDGWVADACASHIDIRNSNTNPNLVQRATNGTYIGFSVHNDGQFLSCMNNPKNNCDIDSVPCHHMSDNETPLKLDGKEHYVVAYLNDHRTTGVVPRTEIKGAFAIKSDEEIAKASADKIAAAAKAAEDKNYEVISNCIKKASDADTLESLRVLISTDLTDPSHKKTALDKIMSEEKALEAKEVTTLKASIAALRKKANSAKTGLDDIDDIKSSVYDLASQLDEKKDADLISQKDYDAQEDVLAGVIQKLIELRVSDDPNAEAFEDARAMLDEALSGASSKNDDDDGSDGTGLHPSKKVQKELEAIYPILRRAKVSTQLMSCMEDEYQLGGKKQASAARDCKEAQKDFDSETKALEKEYKGCLDKNGDDSKKRQTDKDFAAQCKEVEDEFQALQEVPSVDQAAIKDEYQAAVAKAQKAKTGGTGIAALGQQNTLQNQLGLQNGQFAGSPQSPTFGNAGIPVMGTANGLGVNQLAYAPGAAMMPGLTYNSALSPVAQQTQFNPYSYMMH
jgi:hypothetical protein